MAPDVEICYVDANQSVDEHLETVAREKPSVYGLSFASPLSAVAKPLLRRVRAVIPDALIVCGGAHPTADPSAVLTESPADICCLGEAEETFAELVKQFLGRGQLATVAGIAYKQAQGEVAYTEPRPPVRDLDSIPPPAWDLVDPRRFWGLRHAKSWPCAEVVASRGCAFNCTFCANPVWNGTTPRVRRRSPAKISQEVELLYQRGVREVLIRAAHMNDNLEWAIKVFEALHALNHPDLYFQCNLRLDHITPDLAASMRRAGCWSCNVGLESGSQRVLDGIKKKIELSAAEAQLGTLKDHGIKVFAFLMLYQLWELEQGLQIETTREVFRSLCYVLSLRSRRLVNQMSWAFATPYPGSELYRICKKFSLLSPDWEQSLICLPDRMTISIPGLSKLEIVTARAAGLFVQALLNLSNRERYQLHTLGPNLKHGLMKVRHLLGVVAQSR
jgi:radical SAM superfamily enzyme YgiQ (UPF0313 family)